MILTYVCVGIGELSSEADNGNDEGNNNGKVTEILNSIKNSILSPQFILPQVKHKELQWFWSRKSQVNFSRTELTGTNKVLKYLTDAMVLGLSISGALIGGIIITLVAGYLIMKR